MPKHNTARRHRMALVAAAATAALAGLWGFSAAAGTLEKSQKVAAPSFVGKINLRTLAAGGGSTPPPLVVKGVAGGPPAELRKIKALHYRTYHPYSGFSAETLSQTPQERPSLLAGSIDAPGSFTGLTHYDQRILADNGNQFSLEPPDQALAVGNRFVLEVVNNAIQIYDGKGNALLSAPVSTNRFMNQVSAINRSYENEEGPFLSDPRAYYDAATGHFFVSEWATLNDASGNPLFISVQFLAVSATNDPTGNWYIYSWETTNSNTPGCPCLPDFNMLGADANGIYVSNNLFSLFTGGFVGATIYALPKAGLETATNVTLSQFPILPNDFSIHPTALPPNVSGASEANGTEYAVEAEDDLTNSGTAKSVNVWAISGTNTLTSASPALTLNAVSVPAEKVNAVLPPAPQMDGTRPLGASLSPPGPVPTLNPDDGRFSAMPYYVNGQVYAVASTAVVASSTVKTGVATYILNVSGGAPALAASVAAQSIISAPGNRHLLYPAVAVNSLGQAAIGVTITGAKLFPSTAVILTGTFGPPTINLSAAGAVPADGFTGYTALNPGGGGVERWGDYGEGAVGSDGSFYFGNEYVPDPNVYPRSTYANWGTYITHVKP
ncbi:MAG TPA: hypothetical protein VGS12_13315 [Caulobacteraceae bacterium]|nr:hypothetical protein [Caulobacteraceae bacterium]